MRIYDTTNEGTSQILQKISLNIEEVRETQVPRSTPSLHQGS